MIIIYVVLYLKDSLFLLIIMLQVYTVNFLTLLIRKFSNVNELKKKIVSAVVDRQFYGEIIYIAKIIDAK